MRRSKVITSVIIIYRKMFSLRELRAGWQGEGSVCIAMAFPAANIQQAVSKQSLCCRWEGSQQAP